MLGSICTTLLFLHGIPSAGTSAAVSSACACLCVPQICKDTHQVHHKRVSHRHTYHQHMTHSTHSMYAKLYIPMRIPVGRVYMLASPLNGARPAKDISPWDIVSELSCMNPLLVQHGRHRIIKLTTSHSAAPMLALASATLCCLHTCEVTDRGMA